MWKWMGLFLRKNHLLWCWGWPSLLDWIGVLTLSISLKPLPRKLEPGFILWSFFLLRLLFISINPPYVQGSCMEYCCHIWAGAPSCYLELLEYAGLLVLHLLLLLNPWLIVKMWPAQVFSIGITLVDVLQNWLDWFHFLFLEGGLLVILIECMIFLSPFLYVTRMYMSTVSFLTQLDYGIPCL